MVASFAFGLVLTTGCSKWRKKDGPYYKWLDVGFTFDRNMDNCGIIRVRTETARTKITRDGKFGRACHFAGNAAFRINDLKMPDEGTWALWFKVADDADLKQEMRIIDANHYRFSIL